MPPYQRPITGQSVSVAEAAFYPSGLNRMGTHEQSSKASRARGYFARLSRHHDKSLPSFE